MTVPAPRVAGLAGPPADVGHAPAPGAVGAGHGARASSPGDATRLAETAVLGALLHRPARLADVQGWLRPLDFADPELGSVYSAIQELHGRGELQSMPEKDLVGNDFSPATRNAVIHNVLAVRDVLADRPGAGTARQSRLMTELYLAAPPSTTPHHAHYAERVLESSARRQIEQWAVRTRSVGGSGRISGDLRAIQDHDRALSSGIRGPGAGIPVAEDPASFAPAVPPSPLLVDRAEKRLIGSVLAGKRPDLIARFMPEDLTGSPANAATWRAIRALATASPSVPVDPVTVAWEGEIYAEDHGQGLPPDELMDLARKSAPVSESTVSTVVHAALHHHAHQASDAMQAAARDRKRPLHEVRQTVDTVSAALRMNAERLAGAVPEGRSAISRTLDGPPPVRNHPAPGPGPSSRGRSR
ncbi:DnaB-like helicase N-terminal domain-containing protein [Amycolatopsis rubida]|uniref:DnaB-like helicase N terminal domain-containing protein n=1 Tax=Amycolatopsis rubida TaxID=112413 RepID=A0A1I5XGY5_9PSEU|nr:DnaB-like helicase N-terminal domain-containing protein [Amycolatopsis rubida]SFQ31238.1 DnaB-like helicase N terminal domain-containing protein [Amycolatopsis rubida]